jgi:hypothetical protein
LAKDNLNAPFALDLENFATTVEVNVALASDVASV